METQDLANLLQEHGYIFEKKIGKGSFGSIFLVMSIKYNTHFVIKMVTFKDKDSGATTAEVQNLSSLDHPNIIKFYEYFESDNNLYLVFEYCENGSLNDLIRKEGPIRPPRLYSLCKQISSALCYCHSKHIAHRDIKPANILVDSYGRLKLCDFGLSAQISDGERCNKATGSFLFMAPEILDRVDFDPYAADIWALGISFYIMVAGVPPWYSNSRETLRKMARSCDIRFPPSIDRDFAHLIRSMVDLDPATRLTISNVVKCPLLQQMNSVISLGEIKFDQSINPFQFSPRSTQGNITPRKKASENRNPLTVKSYKVHNSNRQLAVSQVSKKRPLPLIQNLRNGTQVPEAKVVFE